MVLKKVNNYLFIAYEMYVKERTKEQLNQLNGIELVMELDDFKRWLFREGIV